MLDLIKSLFENPGTKLKKAVVILYAVAISVLVVSLGILCLVILFTVGFGWFLLSVLASALILILFMLSSWLAYIASYGLGELMENVEQINKSILTINANLKQQKADSNAESNQVHKNPSPTTNKFIEQIRRSEKLAQSQQNQTTASRFASNIKSCPYCGEPVTSETCDFCGKENNLYD